MIEEMQLKDQLKQQRSPDQITGRISP